MPKTERKMQKFKEGSISFRILSFIAETGETSYQALNLLMPETSDKVIHNKVNDLARDKYVVVSGKGRDRHTSIRLSSPKGLEWLKSYDAETYERYMTVTSNHTFASTSKNSSNIANLLRRHRIASVTAIMKSVGVETGLDNQPLSLKNPTNILDSKNPKFYTSTEMKNIDVEQRHKTEFTRFVGCLFFENNAYMIYNIASGSLKWSEQGEQKAKFLVHDVIATNSNIKNWNIGAIIFGDSLEYIFNSLEDTENHRHEFLSFFNVMQNVYALPLDNNGRIMLQQFLISDFHNKINIRLFGRKLLEDSAEIKDCDCDIVDGNRRVLGFLTGNIARLKRFTDFAEVQSKTAREFEIICYKFQEIELKKYCPKSMSLLIV